MERYTAVIGLEIHAELKTRTKMFCACLNDPNETHPNINVCPICLGHPGTLPVPNREAIRLVQRVGAAMHCALAPFSKFDRKNYFYPDLPKGYQISQYDLPLCSGGFLDLENGTRVRLRRIHLEEDTGKLVHPEGEGYSVVDFNRAGVPLMELVTEPDLRSAEDVALFASEFQRILRYLRASDANMEKGEMRVEVNISLNAIDGLHGASPRNAGATSNHFEGVRRSGARAEVRNGPPRGVKVEIKNLNSIRSARMAVAYEIERQSRILERGDRVRQETRGWHDTKQITFSQRSKEEAHDYRYFPEPDIPPLTFTEEDIASLHRELPELPAARRQRFVSEFGLSAEETAMLVDERTLGDFFEEAVSELFEWASAADVGVPREKLVKLAANYLLSDLRGILAEHATAIEEMAIRPEDFAELVKLVAEGKVTSRVAKDILREMFSTGRDPSDILEEQGLQQLSDEAAIREAVARVIADNPKPVADFRAGKEAALQFLVGKLMADTKGRANPDLARKLMREAIEGST